MLKKKPEELKIFVHQYLVGGGFGGKQDYDDILAAAYCVKETGRPVKLIHTRESNFATSFARTPTYHKIKAGIKNGELVAMNQDIVCGWMGARFGVGKKYGSDWLQLDSWEENKRDIDQWSIGGSDHWYYVKNHRVRAWNHEPTTWAVQASALRTVSNSYNIFVVESFMDEIAIGSGTRPARVPVVDVERQRRQSRHTQLGLSARERLRLLHGPALDLPAMGDGRIPGRSTNRPRSVARCVSPIVYGWRQARRVTAPGSVCRPIPVSASR